MWNGKDGREDHISCMMWRKSEGGKEARKGARAKTTTGRGGEGVVWRQGEGEKLRSITSASIKFGASLSDTFH